MAVYEGRGYELYAPCNKRSFGATWPLSWGPLVLFPVGDFLRIPSLKELWEFRQCSEHTKQSSYEKFRLSIQQAMVWFQGGQRHVRTNYGICQWICCASNCSLFNEYYSIHIQVETGGSARLFWSFKNCIVDRILVSAQEPKEEKCHKLWAASILVYIHLTSSIQYTWHINYG